MNKMQNCHFLYLTLFALTAAANAVEQYLTFYSKPDQQGSSVTLRENFADLEGLGSIINSNGSWEAVGWWDCFYEQNYTNFMHTNELFRPGTSVKRGNLTARQPGLSCRHWGASDLDTQAISLYSRPDNSNCLGGEEILVTGPAYGYIPFNPSGVATTGNSNWTFFEGSNFDGKATCFVSNSQAFGACVSGIIRSVYKNCLGRIDEYIYA